MESCEGEGLFSHSNSGRKTSFPSFPSSRLPSLTPISAQLGDLVFFGGMGSFPGENLCCRVEFGSPAPSCDGLAQDPWLSSVSLPPLLSLLM